MGGWERAEARVLMVYAGYRPTLVQGEPDKLLFEQVLPIVYGDICDPLISFDDVLMFGLSYFNWPFPKDKFWQSAVLKSVQVSKPILDCIWRIIYIPGSLHFSRKNLVGISSHHLAFGILCK